MSHIAFVSGDLLIFRHGEGLVHWTSSHQFAPHTDITRQLVPKAQKSLQAVARISEYPLHRTQDGQAATLFVETRASVIYRISISVGGNVTIQELFSAKVGGPAFSFGEACDMAEFSKNNRLIFGIGYCQFE